MRHSFLKDSHETKTATSQLCTSGDSPNPYLLCVPVAWGMCLCVMHVCVRLGIGLWP